MHSDPMLCRIRARRAWPFATVPAALLATLLLTGAAGAEKLVIGFEDLNLYPYGKPSETDTYVGYLRAILDAYAADRGHELEFAVTPLKRLFLGFRSGEVDMFVPDNPAWSQKYKEGIHINYSATIAVVLDGFAVLPGRENETTGEDIVHIGAILGVTVEPLFEDAALEELSFDRASRFAGIFRSLFLERVDAVHCNLAVANHVLATLGKRSDSVSWNTTLPRFKSDFHVSSTRRDLIEELDRWLRANADKVTALKNEYGILEGESMPWGE